MLSLTTCGKSVRLLALTIEEISYYWTKNVYINYSVFYGFWPMPYQKCSDICLEYSPFETTDINTFK